MASSFKHLLIWQKAHLLVIEIYNCTDKFPASESFRLSNQFIRAGISIAANIAEGFSRNSSKDKLRFYGIAEGSIQECIYYCILVTDRKYLDLTYLENQLEELALMLRIYMKKIRETPTKRT